MIVVMIGKKMEGITLTIPPAAVRAASVRED